MTANQRPTGPGPVANDVLGPASQEERGACHQQIEDQLFEHDQDSLKVRLRATAGGMGPGWAQRSARSVACYESS
jgi:hypothetical protein